MLDYSKFLEVSQKAVEQKKSPQAYVEGIFYD